MKFNLIAILSLTSLNCFASNLHCVSSLRSDNQQVTLQGQAIQGDTLTVNVQNEGKVKQVDVMVNHIKPFDEYVEINGIARNLAFVGGGQMDFQLILPFKNIKPALLRTKTPVFNQAALVEEIEMACGVQNLYQIPPSNHALETI